MSGKLSIGKKSIASVEEAQAEFCARLNVIIRDEFSGEGKRLAKAADFDPATLSKVLARKRAPTAKFVGGVAAVLKSRPLGDGLIAAYAVLAEAEAQHFRSLFENASDEEFTKASLYSDKPTRAKAR